MNRDIIAKIYLTSFQINLYFKSVNCLPFHSSPLHKIHYNDKNNYIFQMDSLFPQNHLSLINEQLKVIVNIHKKNACYKEYWSIEQTHTCIHKLSTKYFNIRKTGMAYSKISNLNITWLKKVIYIDKRNSKSTMQQSNVYNRLHIHDPWLIVKVISDQFCYHVITQLYPQWGLSC